MLFTFDNRYRVDLNQPVHRSAYELCMSDALYVCICLYDRHHQDAQTDITTSYRIEAYTYTVVLDNKCSSQTVSVDDDADVDDDGQMVVDQGIMVVVQLKKQVW